MIYNSVYLL